MYEENPRFAVTNEDLDAQDPTTCKCKSCSEEGAYNRHIRVSPTLTINVQYVNTLDPANPTSGNCQLAVEMDGTTIPQIRELFRPKNPKS